MKSKGLLLILSLGLLLSGCNASADNVEDNTLVVTEPSTVTELQIDDNVQIENGDQDVAVLGYEEVTEETTREHREVMGEDLSLFTPEDVSLLDNIGNQDWTFVDDPTWILRFDEDVLIIGQENGQVTDILKYQITSINHETTSLIIHVVERINEHSQIEETTLKLSYYCELVIENDQLTYRNKVNDLDQMTETVWNRKH